VAFSEDGPLLSLGGTFTFSVTDEYHNVVFSGSETFRLARGISEDRFMTCTFTESSSFEDPELGILTATTSAELLVLAPGR